jgi:hypothetical protein
MPKINKTESGLLLYEDFKQSSLIWTPSPNNYEDIEFGEDGLRIRHSDLYKTITLEEPKGNFSFMCKINHKPIDADDIGGVIIMSNDTFYAECQSYVATKPSYIVNSNQTEQQIIDFISQFLDKYVEYTIEDDDGTYPSSSTLSSSSETNSSESSTEFVDVMYPYIKFTKVNTLYTFWASTDCVNWIEVGNTELSDSNRIGFFLYSFEKDITDSNFYIEYAVLYNNNYVIIDNIKENQDVELRTEDGALIYDTSSKAVTRKNNQIFIDTTLLKIPFENIRMVVLQDKQIIYEYEIPELVGGDKYSYWYDIKVCIDNQELNQEELFDLGTFYHHDQTVRIDIYNQEEYELQNLKVSITSYSPYYDGNETVGISLYDENEENYSFSDFVVIPSIQPTEGKSVLIKLTDKMMQNFYRKAGAYRFKINIE